VLAGGTEKQEEAARAYADAVGRAFQIRDDLLDVVGDEKVFGKPVGSDAAEQKATFAALWGVEACQKRVEELTAKAIEALGAFPGADFLVRLSESLCSRVK